MSNKPKMTKDTIPENFTLSLAFVDALPVLFFGGSMIRRIVFLFVGFSLLIRDNCLRCGKISFSNFAAQHNDDDRQ